jgi:hypothetical protein
VSTDLGQLQLQDTPINDSKIYASLLSQVKHVELALDSDASKQEKLELRFQRVTTFLDYLEQEEQAERRKFALDGIDSAIAYPIVPTIRAQYAKEVASIKRRVGGFAELTDEPEAPIPPSDLINVEADIDTLSEELPPDEDD